MHSTTYIARQNNYLSVNFFTCVAYRHFYPNKAKILNCKIVTPQLKVALKESKWNSVVGAVNRVSLKTKC